MVSLLSYMPLEMLRVLVHPAASGAQHLQATKDVHCHTSLALGSQGKCTRSSTIQGRRAHIHHALHRHAYPACVAQSVAPGCGAGRPARPARIPNIQQGVFFGGGGGGGGGGGNGTHPPTATHGTGSKQRAKASHLLFDCPLGR
jgi:hypothetical protein